ncbi:hypothetical protein [Actinosynnema sp. NPDC023587]|uniref:hypothetical protein n=1 Tax=Actinosynnema sp. NPDC023587 TaxID=3154695 RepID=UPI0033C2554F
MADQPEGTQPTARQHPAPQAETPPVEAPRSDTPQSEAPRAEAPQAAAGQQHIPPPHVPPTTRGGFGRFARHRATQLVAVGLIGLVLGGGLVALFDRGGHGRGDRPGLSRMDDRHPGRGPGRDSDRHPGREFRDLPR